MILKIQIIISVGFYIASGLLQTSNGFKLLEEQTGTFNFILKWYFCTKGRKISFESFTLINWVFILYVPGIREKLSVELPEPPPGCFQENTDSAGKTICPDGQKCPMCPGASCDQPYTRNVVSASECQRICQVVNSPVNCEYFVYDQRQNQNGWCWLKFGLWIVRDQPWTTLGKKNC